MCTHPSLLAYSRNERLVSNQLSSLSTKLSANYMPMPVSIVPININRVSYFIIFESETIFFVNIRSFRSVESTYLIIRRYVYFHVCCVFLIVLIRIFNKQKRISFPTKNKEIFVCVFPTGKCAMRSEISVEKTVRVFIAWTSASFIHPIVHLNVVVVIEEISIIMYASYRLRAIYPAFNNKISLFR